MTEVGNEFFQDERFPEWKFRKRASGEIWATKGLFWNPDVIFCEKNLDKLLLLIEIFEDQSTLVKSS